MHARARDVTVRAPFCWCKTVNSHAPETAKRCMAAHTLRAALPSELGRLERLQHLRIDYASLGGSLPSELGKCADLATLSLEHNAISGSIPLQLGGNWHALARV